MLARLVALALVLAACGSSPPAATPGRSCIEFEGIERCWQLERNGGDGGPAPLVVDLHGFTATVEDHRSTSGFEELAEREGLHIVWPEGHRNSWNAGAGCCGRALTEGLDDVAFLRTMIEEIVADQAVDADRVYLTGLSNGCAMAQRMAGDASDVVAAVACMALYLLDDVEPDYAPVPVMELHGTDDGVVPFDSVMAGDAGRGAPANLARWARLNGCEAAATDESPEESVTITRHGGCERGAEVALVTIEGGGHILYEGEESTADTTAIAWEFLQRFRRS